jgi:hypothetical protein
MSVELNYVILVAAGFVVSLGIVLFAGFVWFRRRMDKRFDEIDQRFEKFDERFAKMHQRFGEIAEEEIAKQLKTIDERLAGVQAARASARLGCSHDPLSIPRLSASCCTAVWTGSLRSHCLYPRRPTKPIRCTFPQK